jgi:hypothetical protein
MSLGQNLTNVSAAVESAVKPWRSITAIRQAYSEGGFAPDVIWALDYWVTELSQYKGLLTI